MIISFDSYYYDGYSYTVGGVFEKWDDKKPSYYITSKRECIDSEYIPGELYKRELPCIMQCLEIVDINTIDTIIVDGFVWLSNNGYEMTKGLGKHLQTEIEKVYNKNIMVVGIAKNKYHTTIPNCIEIKRGKSKKPLWITCSVVYYTEQYAKLIEGMSGENRIPDIIKMVDMKTRTINN